MTTKRYSRTPTRAVSVGVLTVVVVGGMLLSKNRDPEQRAIEKLQRACRQEIYEDEAERLRAELRKEGLKLFDSLARFATGVEPAACRGVAVTVLFDLADKEPLLVSRFLRELRPIARDHDLRDLFSSLCKAFGPLVNDDLIPQLASEDPWERRVAVDCLVDNNANEIADHPSLKDYDPSASEEERQQFMKLWLNWWLVKKESKAQ